MILFLIIFTAVVILSVIVALALRSWGREEARAEALLDSPTTHTLAYVVPDGQDPAILTAALHSAGFEARAHQESGVEILRIACLEDRRAEVRRVIEHVDSTGFDGAPMRVAPVRFADDV